MAKKLELTAVKRKDGRYAVKKSTGGYLNGDEKLAFLVEKGLVKVTAPKKVEEAPAATEEAPTEA
jgi:hypothetical protein